VRRTMDRRIIEDAKMHPIIWTMIRDAMAPKRTCPACKRVQPVLPGKRNEPFTCKFCGAQVPALGDARES